VTTKPTTRELVADRREQYAFHDDIVYLRETGRGLSRETVEEISKIKDEPEWMLQLRLRGYLMLRPVAGQPHRQSGSRFRDHRRAHYPGVGHCAATFRFRPGRG